VVDDQSGGGGGGGFSARFRQTDESNDCILGRCRFFSEYYFVHSCAHCSFVTNNVDQQI